MSNIEQPPREKSEVASTALEEETGLKVNHPTVNEALLAGLDGAYVEKAELVAAALRTIGMNRWQYIVWAVCGFGWVVDNIAGYGMSVTYTPVANEFVISDVAITGIAYNLGAFIGALFWGPMADVIGRRWAFNSTLFLAGIFIIAAGGSNNIYTYGGLFGMVGFASGGNVPVAATVYLEFVPSSGYYLLVMLSAWWAIGAVVDALVAWAFVGFNCDTALGVCDRANNMGWRYTLWTVGALVLVLAVLRTIFLRLPESPYYLLAQGRDAEAYEAIEFIARKSGKPNPIGPQDLQSITERYGGSSVTVEELKSRSYREIFLAQFRSLSWKRLKPLFGTRKLLIQTVLIVWIWAAIGIAYPLYSNFLPLYLESQFASVSGGSSTLASTYRQYCYIAACTVPGPILAGWAVETRLGRKYPMAIGTVVSGIFLYVSTLANTNEAVLALNCTVTIVINFMFAIQYAYTPESFPATVRATANGLCSMVGYVCGMAAPIIASQSNVSANAPVMISGALFLVTGVLMVFLPIETATELRL